MFDKCTSRAVTLLFLSNAFWAGIALSFLNGGGTPSWACGFLGIWSVITVVIFSILYQYAYPSTMPNVECFMVKASLVKGSVDICMFNII